MNYYIYILFSESSGIECGDDRGQAMVIERFIKKQKSKVFIEKLIEGQNFDGILAQLVRVQKLRD